MILSLASGYFIVATAFFIFIGTLSIDGSIKSLKISRKKPHAN